MNGTATTVRRLPGKGERKELEHALIRLFNLLEDLTDRMPDDIEAQERGRRPVTAEHIAEMAMMFEMLDSDLAEFNRMRDELRQGLANMVMGRLNAEAESAS